MNWSYIAFLFPILIIILFYLLRKARNIRSPTIGFYNLSGDLFTSLQKTDKEAFGSLFSAVYESNDKPPTCNVLFLYCQIEPNGIVQGTRRSLRNIIRKSGARIAVVASENPTRNSLAATKKAGFCYANIVLTFQRNGDNFSTFFQKLFTHMKQGYPMPTAWGFLVQQGPNQGEPDNPEALMLTEAGEVVFE